MCYVHALSEEDLDYLISENSHDNIDQTYFEGEEKEE
jgi:hypothetical protein